MKGADIRWAAFQRAHALALRTAFHADDAAFDKYLDQFKTDDPE